MRFIHLKNKEPHIQDKMRFFLEYFLFANEFLGRIPSLPFETPGSLINKIKHHLLFNHPNRFVQYLDSYIEAIDLHFSTLLNPNQDPYRTLLSDFFNPFLILTRSVKAEPSKKKRNKLRQQQQILVETSKHHFIKLLEQFEQQYSCDNIESHVDELYQIICCDDPTHDHLDHIAQRTHLLVTAYRFRGATKGAIDKYVDRIISKRLDSFPLPDDILKHKKDKDKFNLIATEFLKNLNFHDQLNGLKNLIGIEKYNKAFYIFILDNFDLLPEHIQQIDASFGDVRVIWSGNKVLDATRNSTKSFTDKQEINSPYQDFFNDNKVLALIELNYDQAKITQVKARLRVQEVVDELNNYLGIKCSLNNEHTLLVNDLLDNDFTYHVTSPLSFHITDDDISNIKDNAHQMLVNILSDTAERLKRNERVFSRAWKTNDPAGFWQYLENLFFDIKIVS